MKRYNLSNKDQQARAQTLRDKLRNLKLQLISTSQNCPNKKNPPNKSISLINNSTILLQKSPSVSDSSSCHTTSASEIPNDTITSVDQSTDIKEGDFCETSINESISKCHKNIMKKLFSDKSTERYSLCLDPPTSNSAPCWPESSTMESSYENEAILGLDELNYKPENPLTILQSKHKLKYKFNTKYELDYGNNVLRNDRKSLIKPRSITLYNPSMLRLINRKLSENSNSKKLMDSLESAPILNEDKIVCLLENGIQNKSSLVQNELKSSSSDEKFIFVDTTNDNNIKSILKKPTDRSKKNISFSIDVQYYDAITNGDLDTIKQIEPLMSDFSKRTARDKTPLHLAVESKVFCVVDYFIEKGLDVNAQDIRGQTPLHIASYNNDLDIIKLLLENGASPYIFSDFLDGFPSMVINEYLQTAISCISVFEEYNKNLGIINNGVVYPICDWAGDLPNDLPLKEMNAIVVVERNDMLVAKKWRAVDKYAKNGFIPWQIITLYPTRNYQKKYLKQKNGSEYKNHALQSTTNTYNQNRNNQNGSAENE